ncbi:MAG: hypothetical protein F6K25_00205 [Okeania sp. SIO2G4]|nr:MULTISPECIES: hypothetical protein [unclassified Okeania]NEP05202.1 hypothetical protein [Okeania sp. SIO4D6]NEP70573.1 hypothetical protein [Okeania sp. SIO2G5]NEP93258.1 hypothetical protein [Okeania sp. SIO2F5]NEQ89258.1 hypothetical protein [Okeania sp. SIO2G4]
MEEWGSRGVVNVNPHSAPQNVVSNQESGVRRAGDRILEENHSCRD